MLSLVPTGTFQVFQAFWEEKLVREILRLVQRSGVVSALLVVVYPPSPPVISIFAIPISGR